MRRAVAPSFAVNRIQGPAGRLPHEGFERPSHCQFGNDGALYVVDWGEIRMAPEEGGIRTLIGTGTLWRIRRTEAPRGELPPEPIKVPLHAIEAGVGLAGIVGAAIGAGMLVKKALRSGGADEQTRATRVMGSNKKRERLIAWLNDAHAMELALIPVLENHAKDADKEFPKVAAADRRHLEETRRHAELVKGCIERLGEKSSTAKSVLGQMLGAGQSVATGMFTDEVVKNFLSDFAAENSRSPPTGPSLLRHVRWATRRPRAFARRSCATSACGIANGCNGTAYARSLHPNSDERRSR